MIGKNVSERMQQRQGVGGGGEDMSRTETVSA